MGSRKPNRRGFLRGSAASFDDWILSSTVPTTCLALHQLKRRRASVCVTLTALTRQMYEMARAEGYGQDDYTALLKVLEQMTGVVVRTHV